MPLAHKDFTSNIALLASIEDWNQQQAAVGETGSVVTPSEGEDGEDASTTGDGGPSTTLVITDAEQHAVDRAVLEDVYASTAGDTHWVNVDGWDEVLMVSFLWFIVMC